MNRAYEIDPEGYIHDEESEDVLDLDHTQVLNLLDINYEELPDDQAEGFFEEFDARMQELEDLDNEVEVDEIIAEQLNDAKGG